MNWADAKVHLGCGSKCLKGWVNIDGQQLPGVDVVMDLHKDLGSLPSNSLSQVYWSHGPEHVYPDLLPGIFKDIHRALKAGGLLSVATISLEGIFHNAFEKGYKVKDWNAYLYGDVKSTDTPLMAHRQAFTYESLASLMTAAGFTTVRPWSLAQRAELFALNDCARSSFHVTVCAEGLK